MEKSCCGVVSLEIFMPISLDAGNWKSIIRPQNLRLSSFAFSRHEISSLLSVGAGIYTIAESRRFHLMLFSGNEEGKETESSKPN